MHIVTAIRNVPSAYRSPNITKPRFSKQIEPVPKPADELIPVTAFLAGSRISHEVADILDRTLWGVKPGEFGWKAALKQAKSELSPLFLHRYRQISEDMGEMDPVKAVLHFKLKGRFPETSRTRFDIPIHLDLETFYVMQNDEPGYITEIRMDGVPYESERHHQPVLTMAKSSLKARLKEQVPGVDPDLAIKALEKSARSASSKHKLEKIGAALPKAMAFLVAPALLIHYVISLFL